MAVLVRDAGDEVPRTDLLAALEHEQIGARIHGHGMPQSVVTNLHRGAPELGSVEPRFDRISGAREFEKGGSRGGRLNRGSRVRTRPLRLAACVVRGEEAIEIEE